MNCGMFRRNYRCLATPKWHNSKKILSNYEYYYLIYIHADNTKRIKQLEEKNKEFHEQGRKGMNPYQIKKFACNANQSKTCNTIKTFLIEMRRIFPNRKKIRMFEAGGGCRKCKPCNLYESIATGENRKPCSYPNESFNAPESWGIDVYGTLSNLEIEYEIIPVNLLINVGMIISKVE